MNENADGSQDYYESDNESEGVPELTSDSDEDDALSNSTPAAPSAAPRSHDQLFSQFADGNDSPVFCFGGSGPGPKAGNSCPVNQHAIFLILVRRSGYGLHSPQKLEPEIIAVTEEEDNFDDEMDFVRSNSSRSTRIRLQEKFRVIDEKPADSTAPASVKDWVRNHAVNVMAQSGNYEVVDAADIAIGGFRVTHVGVRIYF